MDYIQRQPDLGVRIVRPDYSATSYTENPILNFIPRREPDMQPSSGGGDSDALVGYTYQESIGSPDNPFSLTLVPKVDKNGLTFVDKIKPMDLVFIKEFGKERYCGVVHQVRYSSRMTESGPSRSIIVSGSGLGSLLASFRLVMDYRLFISGPIADVVSKMLIEELSQKAGGLLGDTLGIIYQNFIKLATTMPDTGTFQYGVKTVIDHFVDVSGGMSNNLKCRYELAVPFYQHGVNSVWDIWRSIIPAPIYELFGQWDDLSKTGSYSIIARQCPFEPTDWNSLPCVAIHPLPLLSYDVGFDDSETKTFFYGTIPGSEISSTDSLAISNFKTAHAFDETKWPKYGYRPMDVTLRYFNRSSTATSTLTILGEVANLMKTWYAENDRFLSGTISLISIDDPDYMKYPKAGEKISFLGGQFYVERIARSWAYGNSPRQDLTITRGFRYDANGAQSGPILNLGKRLAEFERIFT